MSTTFTIRRSTILADARAGALSRLPYLDLRRNTRKDDPRVERAALTHEQIARVRVGLANANVKTGEASVEVGGAATAAVGGVVWLVASGATGLFSYALYTGQWIFKTRHPVWGTVFALITMSNLYSGARTLMKSGETA